MFVRKKRAGSARRGKAASKRKPKAAKGGLHLPAGLEQRYLDLIALFLVAFGVYLVFVLFFGWEGGKVGYGVETGLVYLFGTIGARIFTVLMLLTGGMLLTGTSGGPCGRSSAVPSRGATQPPAPSSRPTPTGVSTARRAPRPRPSPARPT
jgi:hypothetical protein